MSFSTWLKSGLKTPTYVSFIIIGVAIFGMVINMFWGGLQAINNNLTPILALIGGAGVTLLILSQAKT